MIELLPIEIARLDFENGGAYEFGYLFALRESSWAGALAPARFDPLWPSGEVAALQDACDSVGDAWFIVSLDDW